MWIFVFSPSSATSQYAEYTISVNSSMGYAFLSILSIATTAVGLTYSVFHSSIASRYITKYTKLSPFRFLIEDFLGSLITILIVVFVIFLSVFGFAVYRWGIQPKINNPIGVFIDLLLAGIGYYWFSYTIALALIVTRRTRAIGMTSFIPLIVGFISYFELWIDLKSFVYIAPFTSLPAIIMYHASGAIPPTGAYISWIIGKKLLTPVNLKLAAASLIAWIAAFICSSLVLLRKSRGIPIEEIRI